MTILLVEDSPDDVAFFLRAVRSISVEIVVINAFDGVEALKFLEDGATPDHIFVDLHMPLMSGVQFLSEIQNRFGDLTDCVTVLSGQGWRDDNTETFLPPHFYQKPGDLKALTGLIRSRVTARANSGQ